MFKRLKNPFEKEAVKGYESREPYGGYQATQNPPSQSEDHFNETPPRVFEMHPPKDTSHEDKNYSSYRTSMLDLDEELDEQDAWDDEMSSEQTKPSFLDEEAPETTIGQGVTIKGELLFERLIRIDGCFEGNLVSNGKLIVGPSGVVKSNITLSEAIIEGKVEGNLLVKGRLELRGEAQVKGDITAKSLSVDEGVSIIGEVRVSPFTDDSDHSQQASNSN